MERPMKSGQLTTSEQTRHLMAEVFDANEPLESAVVLRLAAAREKRRSFRSEGRIRRRFAWGAALSMLCLCGTALGVAVKVGVIQLGPLTVDSPPASESSSRGTASPNGRTVGKQADSVPPINEDSDVAAEPTKTEPASAGPRHSSVQDERSPGQGSDAIETPEQREATWQEVADAMRAGQDERAKEAIDPLEKSEDPETRDGAELVRLRIELGSRNAGTLHATSAQRARLQRLARHGATPSIRASARRLIGRLAPVGVRGFEDLEE